MKLSFQFHIVRQTIDDEALLDSRATKNFLNKQVWKSLQIGCFKLKWPLTVNNINGTENRQGKVMHYC